MNELALFAGVGGGILGGLLCEFKTVCAVEINRFRRERLLQRQMDGCLPKFPIWDDVKTFSGNPWRGRIDIITGGFPCQDISCAGTRKGLAGSRSGLVFEMLRIIREVQPLFVLAENSPQLRTNGLGTIIEEFDRMGYVGRVGVLGAWHVGANQRRDRMWLVAVSKSIGCGQRRSGRFDSSVTGEFKQTLLQTANTDGERLQRDKHTIKGKSTPNLRRRLTYTTGQNSFERSATWWRILRFAGMDDGMANRLDRIKATGDGQVPAVARLAWHILSVDWVSNG